VSKTLTVLQHVAWEGPGLIASIARQQGLHVDIHRLDLGASVPKAEDVRALVVMGGPMGAYEANQYPFLLEERSLIAEIVKRGRPGLGVCLGAQLLAHALGARVFPGPKPEIGFGTVQLTADGMKDSLLGPAGPLIPVFHWHGDTFDLPEKAVLLASSSEYPHQAFRIGSHVYGLQFHVEPDADIWSAWRPHLSSIHDSAWGAKSVEIERVGRELIARFLGLVAANAD
jgi:GMP synthase-like glutamine amidotransferase